MKHSHLILDGEEIRGEEIIFKFGIIQLVSFATETKRNLLLSDR